MTAPNAYAEVTVVPRVAIRLPLPLPAPDGFIPERSATWPEVTGRLEYVAGRLEYMPPCGELQQRTAADVVTELNLWRRLHPEFAVGGNEAGMLLGGDVRAADAAVWRVADRPREGFARTPPVLAVEITGADETMDGLMDKARWYLEHGVLAVWIVDPHRRSARVVAASGVVDVQVGEQLPEVASLPGLAPVVAEFFRQID